MTKIRFLKTVSVDVENRHGEVYDKSFNRWDELKVAEIYETAGYASIKTMDGEYLLAVPRDAFERLKEEKKEIDFLK